MKIHFLSNFSVSKRPEIYFTAKVCFSQDHAFSFCRQKLLHPLGSITGLELPKDLISYLPNIKISKLLQKLSVDKQSWLFWYWNLFTIGLSSYVVWVKMNNTDKWLFYVYFWPFFCQLYVYLSQKRGSDGHFEVLNGSTSWLVQTLWPQM